MRYIDTGARDPAHALGTWLGASVLQDHSIVALRWQTGFFGADALGYFAPLMSRLRGVDGILHVLVGSNDGMTTRADMETLLQAAGQPRQQQRIGVVHFENAYFHPKTVHLFREDGSAAAYIGSGNLTGSGITSLHIEAGVLLDTLDGDDDGVLGAVAAAIDSWFEPPREGLNLVATTRDLDLLVRTGILEVPPPAVLLPTTGASRAAGTGSKPRLRPLLAPPALPAGILALAGSRGAATPVTDVLSTPLPPPAAAQWTKLLTRSDAQRKGIGHQRGSITLVKARHPIDAQTYFRYELFASADWVTVATRTGEPLEIARIPFAVSFLGKDLGVVNIEITYARNRAAAQANYTSLLHLGPLAEYFGRYDLEGRPIQIERRIDGTYILSIS